MLRNGGELAYNNLTQPWEHPERNKEQWNNHGFTICIENDLQVLPTAKLDDLKNRTVDKQAIPCIIPIQGSAELNSLMWLDLQKRLRDEEIELLIEDVLYSQLLEDDVNYFDYDSEQKAFMKAPYMQTMFLIQEAVNLSQTWKDGKVKLEEPRSGTKDKIVALSYGNYISTLIENKISKNEQETEFNEEDYYDIYF